MWERGKSTNRLHFHCLAYIPPDGMVGDFSITRDYSTKDKRMQMSVQNSYFSERYGRNDFQPLGRHEDVQQSLRYLMKYIEKSGEKLIYGGDLPSYFLSDILDEDVLCPYGVDDRKAVLADNFACHTEGEYIGRVSKEVIAKLPKAN